MERLLIQVERTLGQSCILIALRINLIKVRSYMHPKKVHNDVLSIRNLSHRSNYRLMR